MSTYDFRQRDISPWSIAIASDGSLSIRGPSEYVSPTSRPGLSCMREECPLNEGRTCGAEERHVCPEDEE